MAIIMASWFRTLNPNHDCLDHSSFTLVMTGKKKKKIKVKQEMKSPQPDIPLSTGSLP